MKMEVSAPTTTAGLDPAVKMSTANNTSTVMSTADQQWALEEVTVKQYIASSMPDSIFNRIKNGGTAKAIWELLTKYHQVRLCMVTVDLHTKMQSMHCSEKDNVRVHFKKLTDMYEQLLSMGTTLQDDKYTSIIFGTLPDSYNPLVSAMTATCNCTSLLIETGSSSTLRPGLVDPVS
ncbi:hypothetical protein NM688_g471 [Phlebia brevispora]|uniref:Uncharacterized protein n=1 Tax=Phlebia brevispora TaxID=194682 RepID=A0ACC1TE79_9APHY|nr:hypothetical protein NM688_g471 [Phlebia brevispora]